MKIMLAADGSKFTKKALTFLVTSKSLATADDELVVFHVQDPVSPLVKNNLGSAEVEAYQRGQAEKGAEADQAISGQTCCALSLHVGGRPCYQRDCSGQQKRAGADDCHGSPCSWHGGQGTDGQRGAARDRGL